MNCFKSLNNHLVAYFTGTDASVFIVHTRLPIAEFCRVTPLHSGTPHTTIRRVKTITFQNVAEHYDNGSIEVNGLSLVAQCGNIRVFVGPSGCGKTTSLRMINRLVEPSSGRILLNGEATEQMDIVQLRRRIGYVIQNAGLFPHKNIIDNIATTAILNGAAKSKARARAGELLEVVGLDPQIAKPSADSFPEASSSAWALPAPWRQTRSLC